MPPVKIKNQPPPEGWRISDGFYQRIDEPACTASALRDSTDKANSLMSHVACDISYLLCRMAGHGERLRTEFSVAHTSGNIPVQKPARAIESRQPWRAVVCVCMTPAMLATAISTAQSVSAVRTSAQYDYICCARGAARTASAYISPLILVTVHGIFPFGFTRPSYGGFRVAPPSGAEDKLLHEGSTSQGRLSTDLHTHGRPVQGFAERIAPLEIFRSCPEGAKLTSFHYNDQLPFFT